MEVMNGQGVLCSAVTQEEWTRIPTDIAEKLQSYVDEKIEELITSKALSETNKFNAEASANALKEELDNNATALNELQSKYDAATATIAELEVQVSTCTSDMNRLQTTCIRLESETADFRHQRNLAFGDRDELTKSLDRRNSEIERLNHEITSMKELLQDAINVKCLALADAQEVSAMKLTCEYKEKRFEHERATLLSQNDSLTATLNERVEELLNLKKDNSLRCVQLENKLIEKTEELAVANESIKYFTNHNNTLSKKIEDLTDLIKSERDKDAKTYELYQQEVEAQTKMANLYKDMSEKANQQVEELAKAVSELQNLLHDATEKYGDLETKHKEVQLSCDEIVQKKNSYIDMLKQELEASNDSLKMMQDDSMLKEVEHISPTTIAASKLLLKSDVSLSNLVTQNSALNMELIRAKEDSQRLETYLQHIVNELEQKGPILKKQREDYESALETIKDITQLNDNLVLENQQLKEEALHCKRNEGIVARENARLKKEISDLSRQVCHLLREIEHRSGSSSTSEHDMSDSLSSGDIITKRLVTFSDIVELQTTNQKLLSVVRELSAKQEEIESLDPATIAQMRMKLETLQETQQNLLDQQESQNKMMTALISQRDMYKTLYGKAIKGTADDIPMQLERPYIPEGEQISSPKRNDDDSDGEKASRHDLEDRLEKAKNEITTLKEENDTYRKEKNANEKILLDQLEDLRKEIRTVTKQNCKLVATAELNEERFKLMQSNEDVCKRQITALEKQNKIYSDSIIKHETTATYLKNETLDGATKVSKFEVRLANIEKENALLKDRESRLIKELEYVKKEAHAKNVLQNNIELIKATLERNEAERQIRNEERLDEAHRECAALRRRLQEEQDHFRELTVHLEKQSNTIQSQMEDERQAAEKLRVEIAEVREELISKQNQMEELTKKIKTSLTTSPHDLPDVKKLNELERHLIDGQNKIESLQQQLKVANNTLQKHCNIAEGAEKQMKVMLDEQESYRKLTETKLREKEAAIMKLEERCTELQGELALQIEGPDAVNMDLRGHLNRLQEEFANTKVDLEEARKKLEAANSDIILLTTNKEEVENKYTREMVLHSNDLQALSAIKEELSSALKEINELKKVKDQAVAAYEENKAGFAAQEEFFKKEKDELKTRFKALDAQNTLLLDQIQTLNSQLSVIQSQATEQNASMTSAGDASFNKSFAEDEVKSSDQLLKIIKYLRQEKDISFSKCEIFEAEHLRLKSQFDSLAKQLEEAKMALEKERQNSEVSMIAAVRQSEVLRKVETLNAITDSNRALRQERDSLGSQVDELKRRITLLEEQVAPLQEKNKELTSKVDSVQSENVTLRGEATRWRQRANILIEKSNRTSPEDWKKLQTERETLAKQLTIERGNVAKLNEELNVIRSDKSKVDEQLRAIKIQQSHLTEESDKMRDELNKIKEQVVQVTNELEQTRDDKAKLAEEKNKVEEASNSKTDTITELRSNLIAVKKIAKKYKQQWEELSTDVAALKQDFEERRKSEALATEKQELLHTQARSELEERITQLEQSHNVKLEEVSRQVTSASEETDNYKKEIETLKQSAFEKEERFKAIFKNAKERIMNLTEQNNNLRAEIEGTRSSSEDVTDKSVEVERLLQEKEEIITEKQLDKEKYSNEIDTLNQRVLQLQRQLGQQNAKPSTSSGSLDKSTTEPPTANIKPMAGHSTNTQTQSVQIQPWRSGPETPLASIRPMSMQLRTVAVLPTSQGASTSQGPSAVVTPQQVHTTGPSTTIEPLSNSPTSSHTEYMPATSSATPPAVGPRQVAVPPTQSTQDTEDDDSSMQAQPTPQQQAVAMVLPRIEQPNNGPAQESGTSSSSSNTVTTTQAGLKRQRDVDNDGCQSDEQQKSQQQAKRTRVQQGSSDTMPSHGTVTDSGLEVEYQVPTSSQRDHEEDNDAVIVVESDDDDDDDGDGPDEGEGVDDDPDTEGYDMEVYPEPELSYDDADCQEGEEDEVCNEVEIVEDSSEVPNQSEQSLQESISQEENCEQPQSEAISSGSDGTSGVTVSQASTSVAPTFSRTRPIAPLSRQQQSHLLLPEEIGDDGIVPSTPTLFVPRRSDGFSEAVSSPNVPTSVGRFTFNESAPSNNSGPGEVLSEQTLEFSTVDDNGTGRSVPGTPLQSSPQESGPSGDDQIPHQNTPDTDIPSITVSGVADEADATPDESMGPPSAIGTAADALQPSDLQSDEMPESEDGVTSEGEKPVASEDSEDEGREAEACPSTNTRSRSNGSRPTISVARRSLRATHLHRGINRPSPTPIVWNEVQQNRTQTIRGRSQQTNFAPRVARRSRGRTPRSPYSGRY